MMVLIEAIVFEELRESLNVEQCLYGGIDVAGWAVLQPLIAPDYGIIHFCSFDVLFYNEFLTGGP